MYIFLTILFSLGLGYSVGVKRERSKYIVIEDENSENEDETTVIKPEKKSILARMVRSIKRNLF